MTAATPTTATAAPQTSPTRRRRRWFPRPSLRLRLTALYSALFLASAVVLLTIANVGARSDVARVDVRSVPQRIIIDPRKPPLPPEAADRFAVSSVVSLLVMVGLSVGLGWIVAGRALRPLRTITATAQRISATNLHERLGLEGADVEFRELGATLDELFDRLESSFESQRHFVANASHELRTPLAAERAVLQVALADPDATVESLRATCEEVLGVGAQQEQLIDALLTLATSERGVERWRPIDLDDIARQAVDQRRGEADGRGLQLEARIGSAATTGDRSLVESLVANLVDNALRHNTEGGRVEVATSTVDGRATLSVWNTGPVVGADQVDRLFRPFQRSGAERVGTTDGHGLGLAIVAAIADAHGAVVVARPRAAGGLDVEVAFTAAG